METVKVLAIVAVIWFLFFRRPATVAPAYRPTVPAPPPPQQTGVGGFISSAAPALGSFFGRLLDGYGSGGGSSTSYSGDDLLEPDYNAW